MMDTKSRLTRKVNVERRHWHLNPGDVVFSEGDVSDKAYRIISGRIELSNRTKTGRQVLSILYSGEIFGEMGMIDALPRSATAMASGVTVVEILTMEDFNNSIGSDEALRSDYLSSLYKRLRATSSKIRTTGSGDETSEYLGRHDKTLDDVFCPTEEEKQALTKRTIKVSSASQAGEFIEKFPFRIGRSRRHNDLTIPDNKPYQVSRNHCCIEERFGHFFVKDLGSKLGTIVNGTRIKRDLPNSSKELVPGENEITLGSANSAFQIRIIIS